MTMTMKRIAILAVVAFGVGFAGHVLRSASSVIKVVPYSATLKTTAVKTGESVVTQVLLRGDGSRIEKLRTQTTIWNVSDKTETVIDPSTRTYVVAPLVARRIPGFTRKSADCQEFFSQGGQWRIQVHCAPAGAQQFNHDLIKVEIHRNYDNGASVSEIRYVIKELGWLAVRNEQYNQAGELAATIEVIDLQEGEPAAVEFQAQAGMQAMPNFLEYAKVTKKARNQEVSAQEAEMHTRKWASVVAEAKAGGDNRFN
jgi:hypothetical protein